MTPETAIALVEEMLGILPHISAESGVCCCGDNMDRHADPMSCGHSPVDMGQYAVSEWQKRAASAMSEGDPS